MGTSNIALRAPIKDAWLDPSGNGLPSRVAQNWLISVTQAVQQQTVLPLTLFGSVGSGSDDTAAFQAAVNQAGALGGATIFIPPGNYSAASISVPANAAPVTFLGCGEASVITRRGALAAGVGMFDISASNVTFDSLVLDGAILTPVGLFYNRDFSTALGPNDPMAPSLTTNTSVWVHGPAQNIRFTNIRISHSGGYAILLDCMPGGISGVEISNCRFTNNRPNLFGVPGGVAAFGSYGGGVYINGDGRNSGAGKIAQHILVDGSTFARNNGNCLWTHVYGFKEMHSDIRVIGNGFLDIGLDGVLMGGVTGGGVIGNVFRRVGYITQSDTDRSVPQWLANLNATAIDSSGLVKSVTYADNVMISVNGGAVDMDGHGLSVVANNVVRIPYPDEPEYEEDQIAISGNTNSGSTSYGINISCTSGIIYGANGLTITGNTLLNLLAGAIRLFAARNCLVSGNSIAAPPNSVIQPITMGPIGPAPGQRCYGNKVTLNNFDYAPPAAAPCVQELDTYGTFSATDVNTVCNNNPINPPGTPAIEFTKSANSGSTVYAETVWLP